MNVFQATIHGVGAGKDGTTETKKRNGSKADPDEVEASFGERASGIAPCP